MIRKGEAGKKIGNRLSYHILTQRPCVNFCEDEPIRADRCGEMYALN